ncbi:MAG: hypothetical protein IKK76_00790 [Alphaproteobacteria bacterium]|nr:hypothetical protein [Alphaproteobacteria bacterium]
MMEQNAFFDEYKQYIALWCGAHMDAADLARLVADAVDRNICAVSVVPDVVGVVWPWLENTTTHIMARFYFPDKDITDAQISDVTVRINTAFKRGAHGAQIFLPMVALPGLVENVHVIRDDLFFDKSLEIGIDIGEVGAFDWADLFSNLRKINASSVLFVLTQDAGDKSDFVGRMYGMLNAWDKNNKFDLHFAFGPNFMRIEQTVRLIESMRPELKNGVKFWIND